MQRTPRSRCCFKPDISGAGSLIRALARALRMTISERSLEYGFRIIGAALAAVLAGGAAAVVLGSVSIWLQEFYLGVFDFLGRGFAFVFAGSVVLPVRWRVGGAVVFVGLGVSLELYLMHSYSSGPEPPLWPVSVAAAGGLLAAAVQYLRRPRRES